MPAELDQIGARLRAARLDRGLTLAQLAEDARMSPSTLSRLESGKRQASLELLVPLTRRLGIRLDHLVPSEPRDPRVRRAPTTRDGIVLVPLAPEGSSIATYRVTYPPGKEPPRPRVHDGFEWLYVLSGRLRLRLGEQELTLTRGEAAEFGTRTPHAMWADGAKPAVVISIFNADGVRMHTYATGAPAHP